MIYMMRSRLLRPCGPRNDSRYFFSSSTEYWRNGLVGMIGPIGTEGGGMIG